MERARARCSCACSTTMISKNKYDIQNGYHQPELSTSEKIPWRVRNTLQRTPCHVICRSGHLTGRRSFLPGSPKPGRTCTMTTQTNANVLDVLKAAGLSLADLVSQVGADTLKKEIKAVKENTATLLSCTMDSIVSMGQAGTALLTEAVTNETTSRARAHGLLKSDEKANPASVATLIRYVTAYEDAVGRAKAKAEAAAKAQEGQETETKASDQPDAQPASSGTPAVPNGTPNGVPATVHKLPGKTGKAA